MVTKIKEGIHSDKLSNCYDKLRNTSFSFKFVCVTYNFKIICTKFMWICCLQHKPLTLMQVLFTGPCTFFLTNSLARLWLTFLLKQFPDSRKIFSCSKIPAIKKYFRIKYNHILQLYLYCIRIIFLLHISCLTTGLPWDSFQATM